MRTVARLFASSLLLLAMLLVPLAVQPTAQVSAHHCFGHTGTDGAPPGDVSSNIAECLDAGACLDTQATTCPSQQGQTDRLNTIVKLVVNILTVIVGVIAVIMIIVGGLKYITSGGDSNSVNSAKNTILYAVVGLVVVALAQIIVRFVLAKTKGAAPPG